VTQNEIVKIHLEAGYPIDPITAQRKYGIFRLAARVNDLRARGMNIKTELVFAGESRYARYRLEAN
jgi:lipase chaperone LimK